MTWSDTGLDGVGILGRRTCLRGAHSEQRECSTAGLSVLSKLEARVGPGAGGLGTLEKSHLRDTLSWDRWAGVAEDLGLAWQTTLGDAGRAE